MNQNIYRVKILFIFCIFGTIYTNGQEQPSHANSLKSGAMALEFGIRNNLTLSSFQGATLSAQYNLSQTNAIRAGVGLSGNNGDSNTLGSLTIADTNANSSSGGSSQNSDAITFTLQYLWYMNPDDIVNFYLGAGPQVQYSHSHDNEQTISASSNNYWSKSIYNYTDNSWWVGVSAVMGVEWFVTKSISLHSEYGISILYNRYTSKGSQGILASDPSSSNINNSSAGGRGWQLGNSGVNFGLSVYF
jgi:hypothetical protein